MRQEDNMPLIWVLRLEDAEFRSRSWFEELGWQTPLIQILRQKNTLSILATPSAGDLYKDNGKRNVFFTYIGRGGGRFRDSLHKFGESREPWLVQLSFHIGGKGASWENNGPKQDQKPDMQTTNWIYKSDVKTLFPSLFSAFLTATHFSLLEWFYSLLAAPLRGCSHDSGISKISGSPR